MVIMSRSWKANISASKDAGKIKVNGKGSIEIDGINLEGSASYNISENTLEGQVKATCDDAGTLEIDADNEKIDLTYKLPSHIRKTVSAILGATSAAVLITSSSATDIYSNVGIPLAVGLTVVICAYHLLGKKITLYQRYSPLK